MPADPEPDRLGIGRRPGCLPDLRSLPSHLGPDLGPGLFVLLASAHLPPPATARSHRQANCSLAPPAPKGPASTSLLCSRPSSSSSPAAAAAAAPSGASALLASDSGSVVAASLLPGCLVPSVPRAHSADPLKTVALLSPERLGLTAGSMKPRKAEPPGKDCPLAASVASVGYCAAAEEGCEAEISDADQEDSPPPPLLLGEGEPAYAEPED